MHKIQRFERVRQQLRCLNTYRLYSSQSRLFSTDNKDESEETRAQTDTTSAESNNVNKLVSDNTILDCNKIEDLTEMRPEDSNIDKSVSHNTIENSVKTEDCPEIESANEQVTFAHLLRHSPLMNLGDPKDKIVRGKIFNVVNDDLYIDFGWKFYCVCPKPRSYEYLYVRGAMVKLKILDLELSTKFLGSTRELTLLEAECILMGLWKQP